MDLRLFFWMLRSTASARPVVPALPLSKCLDTTGFGVQSSAELDYPRMVLAGLSSGKWLRHTTG